MTMLTSILAQSAEGYSFMLPGRASQNAAQHDMLFDFIWWYVSAFFFFLIIALMVFFAWKYRRVNPKQKATGTATHSTPLEIAWSLPPLVIVMIMFYAGIWGFADIANPYANAKRIDVRAWKWNWEFQYQLPDGNIYRDPALHVPVNTPIEIVMSSDDVIHSMYVPHFRVKKDVVPGKFNRVWFTAIEPGEYPLYCAEYCGTKHSAMLSHVIVHPAGEFEQWLAKASRAIWAELSDELYAEWKSIDSLEKHEAFVAKLSGISEEMAEKAKDLKPPFAVGQELYKARGCSQCHSVNGSVGQGPTWKGLWLKKQVFTDGREVAAADENYIRESILFPKSHVVQGYNNVMPEYPGKPNDLKTEREIGAIIAYIRSLAGE